MTPEAEMKSLIERLEKATGPDRKLDEAIALTIGWTSYMFGGAGKVWRDERGNDMIATVPNYTASIDAALTLAPANRPFLVGGNATPAYAQIYSHEPLPHVVIESAAVIGEGRGRTPAIALTIAALKARSV